MKYLQQSIEEQKKQKKNKEREKRNVNVNRENENIIRFSRIAAIFGTKNEHFIQANNNRQQ